jgi:hypothetical protein
VAGPGAAARWLCGALLVAGALPDLRLDRLAWAALALPRIARAFAGGRTHAACMIPVMVGPLWSATLC